MTQAPIRVCIGTEPRTEIPRKVLEFSIQKHLGRGRSLELHPLAGGDWRGTGPLRQYTGFSLLRWTIPERFGHAGRAIYLDADQLCLADLGELWDTEAAEDGTCVWCTRYEHRPRNGLFPFLRSRRVLPETSVMLVDCARALGRLRAFERIRADLTRRPTQETYDEVMHLTYLEPEPGELSPWWNVMDGRGGSARRFLDERARLLHFTRVRTQPWYRPDHPGRPVWERHLAEALDAGLVTREEIDEACARFTLAGDRPDGMHPYWRSRFVSA